MRDEPRQITTFCPRCGKPILWSVRPVAGAEALQVSGWLCYCPLSEDEWSDLRAKAAEALIDWPGSTGETVRPVREDDPA